MTTTMTTANYNREPLSEEEKRSVISAPKKYFSIDECMEILGQGLNAYESGDKKKALEIGMQVPLEPGVANAVKSVYGVRYLVDSGFDLSKVLEEYGEGWLDE